MKFAHTFLKALGVIFICTCTMLNHSSAYAAGLLTPQGSSHQALKIHQHHVDVVIENGYAITTIKQVFFNPHNIDLEALYSFPIPEKASVGEFIYYIDGKPVIGEVVTKSQADKLYEQEKQAGREVAKTSQDSYKTFDSTIYPVRANDSVTISLTYIQPVHVDTSIGRYVYPLAEGGVDEQKMSFWHSEKQVEQAFSFNLLYRSSYPVDAFRLPNIAGAQINQLSPFEWTASISNGVSVTTDATISESMSESMSEAPMMTNKTPPINNQRAFTLDQDIVVLWRHEANLPGAVDVVTYKAPGKDKGTFMMTLTPGMDLAPITQGSDWIFVLDYSGSMQGKYSAMVDGVRKGLDKLRPDDRFKIITFNDNAHMLTNGFESATLDNINRYLLKLESERPQGSTNVYDSIQMALRGLDDDRPSAVLLVTDGVANVGKTQKKDFFKLLEQYDVRLFTFVMGNSANRPLLEGMAKLSNGFAVNVSTSDDIVGHIMQASLKLTHQALRDVSVSIKGMNVKNMTPETIGSLYRGQQLIIFGHYDVKGIRGQGKGAEEKATVTVKGNLNGSSKTYKTTFVVKDDNSNPEIERLWAFASIEAMQDQMDYLGHDKDTEQAITDLALEYSLVTEYTSMIVMSDEQFAANNIERRNKKRVEVEYKARDIRKHQGVRSNRVDKNNPMYSKPRPSTGGGGGSTSLITLLVLVSVFLNRSLVGKRMNG